MRKGRIARALTLALISPGESPKSAYPGARRALALKFNHCADGFARMHQIKAFVDILQRHGVGDHGVNLNFAVHVPIDNLWHIRAPTGAAKSRAAPDSARNQLERTGADFSSSRRHPNNHAFPARAQQPRHDAAALRWAGGHAAECLAVLEM